MALKPDGSLKSSKEGSFKSEMPNWLKKHSSPNRI